jgi:hypothetical protein
MSSTTNSFDIAKTLFAKKIIKNDIDLTFFYKQNIGTIIF